MVPYGDRSRRSYSRSCYRYGGSLMSLFRPWKPDYSGIKERVPDFVESYFPQILHRPGKILTDVVGDVVYDFVSGSSSSSYQQNGGPGANRIRPINRISNYKVSCNSRTDAARSVFRTGGRRSGSKPRGPKGTLIKCPKGYHWDKKTGRCLRNRKR